MPMTEKQAFEIIELVSNVYDMRFDEKKYNVWSGFLMNDGDYEPTLRTAKQYIRNGNPYPPKIPNIMRASPKLMQEDELDDKTKTHRWKMENDPEYVERRIQALDAFKQKVQEYNNRGDDYVE